MAAIILRFVFPVLIFLLVRRLLHSLLAPASPGRHRRRSNQTSHEGDEIIEICPACGEIIETTRPHYCQS